MLWGWGPPGFTARLGQQHSEVGRAELELAARLCTNQRERSVLLRKAATRFGESTPHLETTFSKLNRLTNMAAHNPNGAEPTGTAGRDEGYLFWAGFSVLISASRPCIR